MRLFLTFILFFTPFVSFADDKSKVIWEIIERTEVSLIVSTSIEDTKKEILRLYPNITESMLENEFKSVFLDYHKHLLGSYALAYQEMTYEDLVKLNNFYKTEIGIWLLKVGNLNTEKIQNNFATASQVFNNGFINKYHELGFVAP